MFSGFRSFLTIALWLASFPFADHQEARGGMTIEVGILSQYAEGVMPPVVEARQGWGHIPQDLTGIDGFVAAVSCDDLGRTALLSIDGSDWITVMVADCSGHSSTTNWMRENSVLLEISGELAEEYDVVCLCPVPGEMAWLD